MNYLFFPEESTQVLKSHFFKIVNLPTEGYFYDLIEDGKGDLLGFRYHFLSNLFLNSIFKKFITDKRFVFDFDKMHVDILFCENNIILLKNNEAIINVIQDFGNDTVVENGNGVLGICFDVKKNKSLCINVK